MTKRNRMIKSLETRNAHSRIAMDEPLIPRWWAHPDRPCKDDERYTETAGLSKSMKDALAQACTHCPVYYDCLNDLLSIPLAEHYGIRAGIKGKT